MPLVGAHLAVVSTPL